MDIEPLYSEAQAATMLGIKPRSLRTERENGRIGYKRVAGKIMYRSGDIADWRRDGERREVKRCRAAGRARALGSSPSEGCGSSDGTKLATPGSVQLALETAERLIKRSGAGSSVAGSYGPINLTVPVIPLKFR